MRKELYMDPSIIAQPAPARKPPPAGGGYHAPPLGPFDPLPVVPYGSREYAVGVVTRAIAQHRAGLLVPRLAAYLAEAQAACRDLEDGGAEAFDRTLEAWEAECAARADLDLAQRRAWGGR